MIQAYRAPATGRSEVVTASTTAATGTLKAKAGEILRLVSVGGPARIAVGPTMKASATTLLIPEGVPEFFLVNAGDGVSAMGDGGVSVSVSIAFMSR